MPVKVVREHREEDPELYVLAIEDCVKCEKPTRFWWADGCMPLCPDCAKTVTDLWCYNFAKKEGYGPLPPIDDVRKD